MKRFSPAEFEKKWQAKWEADKVYQADLASDKPKYIAMSMFNYPSGNGIHIGHAMNYTISDVMARYKRQQGFESYHPVGWDAFGLPAENYAIKAGVSPQTSMASIIPGYHTQYKAMGWSNDWSREIATHQPVYYKWTQWIFSQMYKNGLAYQDARQQWWCESCQTVLANEQIENGKCWRHDGPDDPEVTKKEVPQWFFRITDYADELLEATDELDWTESVKLAQKNWIGKSAGAEVDFEVASLASTSLSAADSTSSTSVYSSSSASPSPSTDSGDQPLEPAFSESQETRTKNSSVTVFTTRPDTLFGVSFLVLAPEHELVDELTTEDKWDKVQAYKTEAVKKSELERQENKEKSGVFTGSYVVNPINGEKVPVWVADYVLPGYGTGAVMGVPGHDERDNEFAKKFGLKIVEVLRPDTILFPQENAFFPVVLNHDHSKVLVFRENLEPLKYSSQQDAHNAVGYFTLDEGFNSDNENVNTRQHVVFHRYSVNKTEKLEDMFTWLLVEDAANKYPLEYRRAFDFVARKGVFTGDGLLINSGQYDDVPSAEARELIVQHLEQKGVAHEKTNYKIRDWSVSRQRYWGAPIPIVHCPKDGVVLVPDEDLPVVLPELEDFKPSGDGRSALARASEWLKATCPTCGGEAERETDTLDTYICSSWYFLRYFDGANEDAIFAPDVANKWMPIDFYNGGDHATAHMIYARFVTRFFHKLGLVDNPEPFKRFLFNGKVMASDGSVFSKSKGNGIDPLEIINQGYGADALRTYLMFAAPLEFSMRWDPNGVPGTYRWLGRVWNLVQEFVNQTEDRRPKTEEKNEVVLRAIHPLIKRVTEQLEDQRYNTAIAAMMKATNDLYALKKDGFEGRDDWQFALESLVALMAPFAPHTAEELWHDLGKETYVQCDSWPHWKDEYLVGDMVTLAVQVNGKLRGEIQVARDASKEDTEQAALTAEKVKAHIGDKTPKRIIVVPGRLVNIVV